MLALGEDESSLTLTVAGERAGGLLDVGLGVVSLTEGEELKQLARKILVGRLRLALLEVEVHDHRRRARHGPRERHVAAQGVLPQNVLMLVDQRGVLHLLHADHPDILQEEQPFFRRRIGRDAGQLQPLDRQVEQRLAGAFARLLRGDALRVGVRTGQPPGEVGCLCFQLRDQPGLRKSRHAGEAPLQRRSRAVGQGAGDLGGRRAEADALQQVPRGGLVPVGKRQRFPGCG